VFPDPVGQLEGVDAVLVRDGPGVVGHRHEPGAVYLQYPSRGAAHVAEALDADRGPDQVEADLVVLLDVDVASAASRLERSLDRIEQAGEEFHARVAAAYRDLAAADPQRWLVVDGRGSIDEVARRLQAAVAERLA